MKVTIDVEQFDNGISLKWKDADGHGEPEAVVALDREKEPAIGKMIWSDIENAMNLVVANKIKMEITYLFEEEKE
jgi:hypothetical protein